MKITIESTSNITTVDGVPVRHWRGVTEKGVKCDLFVHRIAVRNDRDTAQFEAELQENNPPAPKPIDLRFILD